MYEYLLYKGWPRELARSCLPVNTYSRMFATVDLHNLFHFLRLRLHPHAQHEIRAYATALATLIQPIVPIAFEAFIEDQNRREQAHG
jgi:thymidylate synthase (FAD)